MSQRTYLGMDFSVFASGSTWKAFGISVLMFLTIAYAGLSIFGLTSTILSTGGETTPAPDFEIETINRSDVEGPFVNETGWFKLSEHRGKVVVLDFMAHDCSGCHIVQERIEANMGDWESRDGEYDFVVIAIGAILIGSVTVAITNIRKADLKAATGMMSGAMRYMYNLAVINNRPYRLDLLRTMPLEQVQEMSYVSAIDATTLYGTGYSGGAIRVTSRRRL